MASGKSEKSSKSISTVGTIYLFAYNFIQVFGWSHVLYKTIIYLLNNSSNTETLWDSVNPSLTIFQTAAALEVLNVAVGLVRSSLVTTAFQVASRLFVVWAALIAVPPSRESFGLTLLLFAWCITEIVRYSFYALGLINRIPHFITWTRYTFFYALYPIGVTGEVLVVLSCLPYARDIKPLTVELPNAWNVTFSFHYLLYFILVLYVLIFPSLYKHMINQRKKVLGAAPQQTTKSKTK